MLPAIRCICARRRRDWPLLEQAVEQKIDEQAVARLGD